MSVNASDQSIVNQSRDWFSCSGAIIYEDGAGVVRGHERFIIGQGQEGRTLLARCEIYDKKVSRSVSYRTDADFKPLSSYVEVFQNDMPFSHGVYSFADGSARLADHFGSYLTECGELAFFGAHPLVMDGWIPARKLISEPWPVGSIKSVYGMTSSVTHDGASDPGLHIIEVKVCKEATEVVQVGNRRVSCNVMTLQFGEEYKDPHPAYRMWISDDRYQLFVKGEVPKFDRHYRLVELPDFDR